MKKATHVFLDMDGTLLDSHVPLYNAYIEFLKEYGIVGTKQEFTLLDGPSILEIVQHLKSTYTLPKEEPALFDRYCTLVEERYRQDARLHEDAKNLLEFLGIKRGIPLSLVTSASEELATSVLSQEGVLDRFQFCTFGSEVSRSKPSPEIYLLALSKVPYDKEMSLVVEDSPNGVAAACAAGLSVIAVDRKNQIERLKEAGATLVLKSLNEIHSIFHEET